MNVQTLIFNIKQNSLQLELSKWITLKCELIQSTTLIIYNLATCGIGPTGSRVNKSSVFSKRPGFPYAILIIDMSLY